MVILSLDHIHSDLFTINVYCDPNVLSLLKNIGGGGTRYRPELFSAYNHVNTIGISFSPAPKDIGKSLHRFVSFAWFLPDNDLSKRKWKDYL